MTYELDARHLLCPMPVIRVQEFIKDLQAGDIVEVSCTDPGTQYDIPAWCKVHGHRHLSTKVYNLETIITVQIGDEHV